MPSLLMSVLVVGTIVAAAITCSRAVHAGSNAARATARFDALRVQVQELNELRAVARVGAKSTESKGPKLASVAAEVVAAAGLPAGAISSLSTESESVERGKADTPVARRRATLTLTPLTLPQLGRVLDLWRQRLPSWTIARIDLELRRDVNAAPGADLPLRAVLVVESLSIAPERRTP